MLYAVMFVAGAAWAVILVLTLSLFAVSSRADREMEKELKRGKVHYLRRVV